MPIEIPRYDQVGSPKRNNVTTTYTRVGSPKAIFWIVKRQITQLTNTVNSHEDFSTNASYLKHVLRNTSLTLKTPPHTQ